jgi:hypothetical protein
MIERHAIAVRPGIDLHHFESIRLVELNDVLIDLLVFTFIRIQLR